MLIRNNKIVAEINNSTGVNVGDIVTDVIGIYDNDENYHKTDGSEINKVANIELISEIKHPDWVEDEFVISSPSTTWVEMTGLNVTTSYYGVAYGNDRFVCVGTVGISYYSTDGTTWVEMTGLNSDYYHAIAYGNDRFVCVGNNGKSYYSIDGETWVEMTGLDNNIIYQGVTYGNDRFVCVGYYGISYYSIDGTTWVEMSGSGGRLIGVTYGNGRFVCVGDDGRSYYSTNGTTWVAMTGLYSTTYYGVTYGNDRFVCVGSSGRSYYSTDGTTWVAMTGLYSTTYRGVTYGNNRFVCVGSSGKSYYSTDGTTWVEMTGLYSISYDGVTYGNDRFVCVGYNGISYYSIQQKKLPITNIDYSDGKYLISGYDLSLYESTDNKKTWDKISLPELEAYYEGPDSVSYDKSNTEYVAKYCNLNNGEKNGILVAVNTYVGDYPMDDRVFFIDSLTVTWAAMTGLISGTYYGVTYGNDRFVCVGQYGYSYYSTDGTTWVAMSGLDNNTSYYGVTYGNDRFICIGTVGKSYYSTNGTTWVAMSGLYSTTYRGVTYGNDRFVCVGNSGKSYYSTDGTTWVEMTGLDSANYYAVTYGNDRFVCVGDDDYSYYSTDGTTWVAMTGLSITTYYGVTYGNDRFVCVGSSGRSYYSTNGTTWVAMTGLYNSASYYGVTYGNNRFVCIGSSGRSYYSTNGITWTAMTGLYSTSYYGVTYGNNGRFVCVAGSGKSYYLDKYIVSNIPSSGTKGYQINLITMSDKNVMLYSNPLQPTGSPISVFYLYDFSIGLIDIGDYFQTNCASKIVFNETYDAFFSKDSIHLNAMPYISKHTNSSDTVPEHSYIDLPSSLLVPNLLAYSIASSPSLLLVGTNSSVYAYISDIWRYMPGIQDGLNVLYIDSIPLNESKTIYQFNAYLTLPGQGGASYAVYVWFSTWNYYSHEWKYVNDNVILANNTIAFPVVRTNQVLDTGEIYSNPMFYYMGDNNQEITYKTDNKLYYPNIQNGYIKTNSNTPYTLYYTPADSRARIGMMYMSAPSIIEVNNILYKAENSIYYSTDYGDTWKHISGTSSAMAKSLIHIQDTFFSLSGELTTYYSKHGTYLWVPIPTKDRYNNIVTYVSIINISEVDNSIFALGISSITGKYILLKLINDTWIILSELNQYEGNYGTSIILANGKLFVIASKKILYTDDYITWEEIEYPLEGDGLFMNEFTKIETSYNSDTKKLTILYGNGIYHTYVD